LHRSFAKPQEIELDSQQILYRHQLMQHKVAFKFPLICYLVRLVSTRFLEAHLRCLLYAFFSHATTSKLLM
jgi:hypothetical protein